MIYLKAGLTRLRANVFDAVFHVLLYMNLIDTKVEKRVS
jgi:hypothetical protein